MGSPDPHQLQGCANSRLFRQHVVAVKIVSAVTERGSYPFPFRTRKSSPSSPMVPGPRARESRSLLDSRPLRGKPRRGLFLYPYILFYLQINTRWNIPIWNFDNLSIAIFLRPILFFHPICSLIQERRAILRTRLVCEVVLWIRMKSKSGSSVPLSKPYGAS